MLNVVGALEENGEEGSERKEEAREREKEKEREGKRAREGGERPDKFLSVIMDTSKASRVFNEDHPPAASHRR